MSRAALRDLVYKGRGPTVTKIGRRTFFTRSNLESFVLGLKSAMKPEPDDGSERRKRGRPSFKEFMDDCP